MEIEHDRAVFEYEEDGLLKARDFDWMVIAVGQRLVTPPIKFGGSVLFGTGEAIQAYMPIFTLNPEASNFRPSTNGLWLPTR
jgi:hypothetical protein